MSDLADVRALFEPAAGSVYLDAATYGLPPRPTVDAMHAAVEAWQAGSADWVIDWDQRGETGRSAFASLIGLSSPEAIALVPSVSVGVAPVAASLTAQDEVVVPDDEFTSVLYPILVAQRERGVRVRRVPFGALASSVSTETTLVAFSLVQSQSGRVAALADILQAAQFAGARTLVDATHGVPFVPLDGAIGQIDYLVCAAYKHLLCPRGVAFLYVRPSAWDRLPPIFANWRSTSNPYGQYYGGGLDVSALAARFDVSLAWFSWAGASVSLDLLRGWKQRGVLPYAVELAQHLTRLLDLPQAQSSVVSVPVSADAELVRDRLSEAGIKGAVRAGAVRLAPHVYNTRDDIERAASAIAEFVRQPVRR